MTVEEKAYNYASKLAKNRLTASEVAAHYGRGYIEGQEDMKQLGWHPASELPVIPEGKNWVKVVALVDYGDNTLRPRHEIYKDKGWSKKDMWDVKWWCYPPKED